MYLDGGFTKENYVALMDAALKREEIEAMYELGMTWAVVGSQQNNPDFIERGIALLEKADAAGSADAALYLGTVYHEGKFGIGRDMEKAVGYYKRGAEGGNAQAMSNYGIALQSGDGGLMRDDAQAFFWIKKAADADEKLGVAQYNAALACHAGRGTKMDRAMAKEYFRRAANAGIAMAQLWLGSEDYRD